LVDTKTEEVTDEQKSQTRKDEQFSDDDTEDR